MLVLAVALAANATTFALIDALVLRPFRYPGVGRAVLVASAGHQRFFDRESVAAGDFLDWREQASDVLDRLAAIDWWDPNYTRNGPPQQLAGFRVSAALFEVLGVRPLLGRTLLQSDEDSATPAVVLSQGFWERQFAGTARHARHEPATRRHGHRVVGVMPSDFRVPIGADVWATLAMAPEARAERARGHLMVVGRLRGDTTVEAAERRLQAILAQQKRAFPDTHAKREVSVRSFTDGFRDPGSGPFLAVWQIAALLLLLVACANVVNLVLARNTEREREFAVRLALGASSRRIAWQLLLEGLLLSGGAALLALPLVWASLQGLRAMMPDTIVRFVGGWPYMRMDGRTFAVTAALAVGATVLFAMVPAWRAAPAERHRGPAPGRAADQSRPSARPRRAGRRANRAHAGAAGLRGPDAGDALSRHGRTARIRSRRASWSDDSRSTASATSESRIATTVRRTGAHPPSRAFPRSRPPASPASSRMAARTRQPASGRKALRRVRRMPWT